MLSLLLKKKSIPGYRDKDIHSQAKQGKSVREKKSNPFKIITLKIWIKWELKEQCLMMPDENSFQIDVRAFE